MSDSRHLRRSFLYVPGSEEHKVTNAVSLGPDAVILDFEDAVAEDRKAAARALVREFLPAQPRERVEWAKRILAAWDQAQAEGKGVVALDGELIELPIVARERRVLERAG